MIAYRQVSSNSDTIVFESTSTNDEIVAIVHSSIKEFYGAGFSRMIIFAHPNLVLTIKVLAPNTHFKDEPLDERYDPNMCCHVPAPWFLPTAIRIEPRHHPVICKQTYVKLV